MKELAGKVTLSYRQNRDSYKHDLYIEVRDESSRLPVLEIKIAAEEVSEVFSNMAEIPMTYEFYENSDRLGKTSTHYSMTLFLPPDTPNYGKQKEFAATTLIKAWHDAQEDREKLEPSYYFGSKNTFKDTPGGDQTVTFSVRRYD
jgi:hypothetical protein